MNNTTYLYRSSAQDAREHGELEMWRESHTANVACKKAIEQAIRSSFDGMHLNGDCAKEIIEEFGFLRVGYVLSATLQEKKDDGRFSNSNKSWSEETYVPEDRHRYEFVVDSHPAVLDGFVNLYRKAYDEMNLFDQKHCIPNSTMMDYTGQVLVMSAKHLKESCWCPENQLWLAQAGFGCEPNKMGTAVYATCLGDGEQARWRRYDFAGIIKPECMPEWAATQLNRLKAGEDISVTKQNFSQEMN